MSIAEIRRDFESLPGTQQEFANTKPLPVVVTLPHGYKGTSPLYKHQRDGIRKAVSVQQFAILDEQGLGKSLQALYGGLDLMTGGRIDAVLFVVRSTLVSTWIDPKFGQVAVHAKHVTPGTFVIAGKPRKEREAAWPHDRKIYVVNYELLARILCTGKPGTERHADTLRRKGQFTFKHDELRNIEIGGPDAKNLVALLKSKRCAIVLDESQCAKNPNANVTKVLWLLGKLATHRYIMTGTFIAERPEDAWSQIFFLDYGTLLGKSYALFMEEYTNQTTVNQEIYSKRLHRHVNIQRTFVSSYKNLGSLRKKLQSISIRRTKEECLDLPEKVISPLALHATGPQAKLLAAIRSKISVMLKNVQGRTLNLASDHTGIAARIQAMCRATSCPWLVEEEVKDSVKLDALLDLLEDTGAEQFVVWCAHRDVCEAADMWLRKHDVSSTFIHGEVAVGKERDRRIAEFKEGKHRVLCATMHTMREGYTLTNSRYAYYLDLDFSRLNFEQSSARQHRIGTTGTVVLHIPMVQRTIDVYLWGTIAIKNERATIALDKQVKETGIDIRAIMTVLGEAR